MAPSGLSNKLMLFFRFEMTTKGNSGIFSGLKCYIDGSWKNQINFQASDGIFFQTNAGEHDGSQKSSTSLTPLHAESEALGQVMLSWYAADEGSFCNRLFWFGEDCVYTDRVVGVWSSHGKFKKDKRKVLVFSLSHILRSLNFKANKFANGIRLATFDIYST